jgi:hypothetical protein
MTDRDVEQLVRDVLSELLAARDRNTGEASGTQTNTGIASGTQEDRVALASPVGNGVALASPVESATLMSPSPVQMGQLVVDARLVTLADIAGRLADVKQVVIPPRAVVTPTVRDELRRRNIALVHAAPAKAKAAGAVRLVLVNTSKRFDAATLEQVLGEEGVAVESQRSDCLIAATDLLAGELVKADTVGTLVARHADAALCLANRHPGVRAVLAGDLRQAVAACEAVGANLLVLNPAHAALFQLRQILSQFCRDGVRECPEVFRKRLG